MSVFAELCHGKIKETNDYGSIVRLLLSDHVCARQPLGLVVSRGVRDREYLCAGSAPCGCGGSTRMVAFRQKSHYALRVAACVNVLCCSALVLYFCFRYAPPLAASFDRCVEDLKSLAEAWHTTYVVVNIVIFVLWWLASIAWNLLMTICISEGKSRVAMVMLLLHVAFIVFVMVTRCMGLLTF